MLRWPISCETHERNYALAPRLQAVETRTLFRQHDKGKDCHEQDKQVQGASFGFVFGALFLETELKVSLPHCKTSNAELELLVSVLPR